MIEPTVNIIWSSRVESKNGETQVPIQLGWRRVQLFASFWINGFDIQFLAPTKIGLLTLNSVVRIIIYFP